MMLHRWKYQLGALLFAVVLTIVFSQFVQATPHAPVVVGSKSQTLTTPYGVEMTLVSIEQHGSQLFFHFHAYNGGQQSAQLIGNGGDFHFYYIKGGKFTPTLAVSQADLTTHPALPSKLAAGASADGWVMFDMAMSGTYPHQILYRFGTVADTACSNAIDKNTCHADVAFKALVWNF